MTGRGSSGPILMTNPRTWRAVTCSLSRGYAQTGLFGLHFAALGVEDFALSINGYDTLSLKWAEGAESGELRIGTAGTNFEGFDFTDSLYKNLEFINVAEMI